MRRWLAVLALCAAFPAAALDKSDALLKRGRYIVQTSGCNDCHTPAYPASGGNIPETQWLTGAAIGWRGPWGTTYATNLRLYMQALSEDDWLKRARNLSARPPMPWFAIQAMTDDDLRAIYHYVRSLGAAGRPAPDYVPPLVTPRGPYVQFPLLPL